MDRNAKDSQREERYWYALYTRPRTEKKVNIHLHDKGFISLLPLRTVVRFWSDRKKKIDEPLFPGYVFVNANARERYYSLQTPGVVRMVGFNGEPSRIPEEQIHGIERVLEHGYDPELCEYLQIGDRVEVTHGPLAGLQGRLVQQRGGKRFVISIDAIQQSISVDVEPGQIKRIAPAAAPIVTDERLKKAVSRLC